MDFLSMPIFYPPVGSGTVFVVGFLPAEGDLVLVVDGHLSQHPPSVQHQELYPVHFLYLKVK
jgi:hypothetical protein